eukprot:SAG25_NODE_49_length_18832_cov_5.265841_1_plen_3791_part_10
MNINNQNRNGGLADGDTVGVIHTIAAKHGKHFYTMGDTGGFLYVRMDAVSISDYTHVEMEAWAVISQTSWGPSDFVVIWANSGEAGPDTHVGPTEKVLLDGTNIDTNLKVKKGQWVRYSMKLDGFNTSVAMSFGVTSSSETRSAAFDYIQLKGRGPDRSNMLCSTTDCAVGTLRSYTSGSAQANCTGCPTGTADQDSNPNTPCTICNAGKYAARIGQGQCTNCPGYPRAISTTGASSALQCITDIAYTSFEEPRVVGPSTRRWFECRGTGNDRRGLSVDNKRYDTRQSCDSTCSAGSYRQTTTRYECDARVSQRTIRPYESAYRYTYYERNRHSNDKIKCKCSSSTTIEVEYKKILIVKVVDYDQKCRKGKKCTTVKCSDKNICGKHHTSDCPQEKYQYKRNKPEWKPRNRRNSLDSKPRCEPAQEQYVSRYRDTVGGDTDHMLLNNKGQHPVSYAACSQYGLGSSKSRELGFRTFYQNSKRHQTKFGGLFGGAVIGVIGDSTTPMRGDSSEDNGEGKNENVLRARDVGGGGKAPDGQQYFALEDTNGFVYVQIDPVMLSSYTNVEMSIWVHVRKVYSFQHQWDMQDRLKVWCKNGATNKEIVLLDGTDLDAASHVVVGSVTHDQWTEYNAKLPGFTSTATMAFGLQADSEDKEAFFDYARLYGTGPDNSPFYCANFSSCPSGTIHGYVSGSSVPSCTKCPPGKADTDFDPITPCVNCTSGRYATVAGLSTCTECPGYPTYALSPPGSTSHRQCEHIIGYTSFEEPGLAPLGQDGDFPNYRDTRGGDSNHQLINNANQNPVTYDPCLHGKLELGFSTFYQNTQNGFFNQGMFDGAMIGVISNRGNPWKHLHYQYSYSTDKYAMPLPPHGQQYYVLADTDGFAYVEIDPISIQEYRSVELRAWVRISSSSEGMGWSRADKLKVWAKPAQERGAHGGQTQGSQKEVVLLEGDKMDDARYVKTCRSTSECSTGNHIQLDTWQEYKAKLTGMTGDIVMAFGLQSNEASTNAWFDYFRLFGTGPDRTKLLCPTKFSCSKGTTRTYVTGQPAASCTACKPGTADTDANPSTPCLTCSSGQYADNTGATACTKCKGYPSHARSPLAAVSAAQCEYIIGYTSFEEPTLAPLNVSIKGEKLIPFYKDTIGGNINHQLHNNPGQNPVAYAACSQGKVELGFRTYYSVGSRTQATRGGLANGGDIFGVIGDTTTPHKGDMGQGGKAPHGSQYFAMEETGGFAYVEMDPVSIVDYTKVAMKAWVHVEASKWDSHDRIKVWVTDSSTKKEYVLLEGTDLDDAKAGVHKGTVAQDHWTDYTMNLVGFRGFATMAFGLQSDDGSKEAWFDYVRIVGTGPDRAQLMCPSASFSCANGTQRLYTVGQKAAQCADCNQMNFEDERACAWNGPRGTQQWSTVATTTASTKIAHSGSHFMYLEMKKHGVSWAGAGVGYAESPVVAAGMRSMSFFYHMYGSDMGELSVDAFSASETITGWTATGTVLWTRTEENSKIGPATAQSGTHFMLLGKSDGSAASGYLQSAKLHDTELVSFYYHMYGIVGTLSLEAQAKEGKWTTVWTRSGAQQSSRAALWQHALVLLPSGPVTNFKVTKGSACGGSPGAVHMGSESSIPSILASAAGRWDFSVSLRDLGGQVGDVIMPSNALRTSAGLLVGTGVSSALSDKSLAKISVGPDRTLAAWVTVRSTVKSGPIISINSDNEFDAIAFAEREPAKWMAASNGYSRSKAVGGISETTGKLVLIVVVYSKNQITMYRNGVQYGNTYTYKASSRYKKASWWVSFGPRTNAGDSFDGTIHSAMLWTRPLSALEVREVHRAGFHVDWSDRWQPTSKQKGAAACKAVCARTTSVCSGFDYKATDNMCLWKNGSTVQTMTKQTDSDCYMRKDGTWSASHVRFRGTTIAGKNYTSTGDMAIDNITFIAAVHPPPRLLPALQCGTAACERHWKQIPGSDLPSIWSNPRYPDHPNSIMSLQADRFEMAQRGDNMATMLEGFVRAPATGYYSFSAYSVGESEVRLMLKPNMLPRSASEMHVVVQRRGNSNTMIDMVQDGRNAGIAPVRLLKGEAYYMMALVKTGSVPSLSPGGHRRRLQGLGTCQGSHPSCTSTQKYCKTATTAQCSFRCNMYSTRYGCRYSSPPPPPPPGGPGASPPPPAVPATPCNHMGGSALDLLFGGTCGKQQTQAACLSQTNCRWKAVAPPPPPPPPSPVPIAGQPSNSILAPNSTTAATPTSNNFCNEAQWPDKLGALVCGECKVLVGNFNSTYKTCDGYCKAVGSTCKAAWEEKNNTCAVKYSMACNYSLASNDAICECGVSTRLPPPPPPTSIFCAFDLPKLCTGWRKSGYWISGVGALSPFTGPSKPQAGGRFMFLKTSQGNQGTVSFLISPLFSQMKSVSYYYHMYGATIGTLFVEQLIGAQWTQVTATRGQQHLSQASPWMHTIQALSVSSTQIRFIGTRGAKDTGDIAIDSVTISTAVAPSAPGAGGEALQIGMNILATDTVFPSGKMELVQAGAECLSKDKANLGTYKKVSAAVSDADLAQCAEACATTPGCKFFKFGNVTGACWQEGTSSKSCLEGWKFDSSYSFYALPWWITDRQTQTRAGLWTNMFPISSAMFTTIQLDTSAPPPPAPQPPPFNFEQAGVLRKKWVPTGWSARSNLQSMSNDPWIQGSLALPPGSLRVRFRAARDTSVYTPRDFEHMAVDSINISSAPYVQPICTCPNGTAVSDFTCTYDGQHRCSSCKAGMVVASDYSCIKPLNPCSFETALRCGWTEGGKQHWSQSSNQAASSEVTGAGTAHHGMHLVFLETSRGKPGDASYLVSPPLNTYPNFMKFKSMSFYYHKYGETTGTLSVEGLSNSLWGMLWTHTGETHASQHADWSHGQAPLSQSVTQVRFMGTRETGDTGDISVDRVHFTEVAFVQPICKCENGRAAISGACVEEQASICQSCKKGFVLSDAKTVCATPGTCAFETIAMCGWNITGQWKRVQRSPRIHTGAYRAHSGNYFMMFDSQPSPSERAARNRRQSSDLRTEFFANDQKSYLISPPVAPDRKSVSFSFLMYGATMGTLAVEALYTNATGSNVWITIWSLTGELKEDPEWLRAQAALPPATTNVRFVATRGVVAVRGDCTQWSDCTTATAPIFGTLSAVSLDTVSFSTAVYVQPVCTCPGGTPATGAACIRDGAAICAKCDSGLDMSATRSFCSVAGSCTFDTPTGSSLCGWLDSGKDSGNGNAQQWTRTSIKRVGHYGVDRCMTLSGTINGTFTSPLLIDAKSIAFIVSMSRSTVSVERFRSGNWVAAWSRTSQGPSTAWNFVSVQLPAGTTYVRFVGRRSGSVGRINIDDVTVSQRAISNTNVCNCPHGRAFAFDKCAPSKQQICQKCNRGFFLSSSGTCQAMTAPCTFDISTCGWDSIGSKKWVRAARFTEVFPRTLHTGARDAHSGQFFMFLQTSETYVYGVSVEDQARRRASAFAKRFDSMYLVSPRLSTLVPTIMIFQVHMYGSRMGTLSVDALVNGNWIPTGWSQTGQQQVTADDSWIEASLPLPLSTTQVRFVGTAGTPVFPPSNTAASGVGLYTADMAIDTLRFEQRTQQTQKCTCTNGIPKVGSSCPADNAARCALCDPGYILRGWVAKVLGITKPVPYDGNGSAVDVSATQCHACPAGQYAWRSRKCIACAPGRYTLAPGSADCVECEAAAGGYGTSAQASSPADCSKCSSDSACRPGYFCNATVGPDGTCAPCTSSNRCGCTEQMMPNYVPGARNNNGSCAHSVLCSGNLTICLPAVIPALCTDGACNPSDYHSLRRMDLA